MVQRGLSTLLILFFVFCAGMISAQSAGVGVLSSAGCSGISVWCGATPSESAAMTHSLLATVPGRAAMLFFVLLIAGIVGGTRTRAKLVNKTNGTAYVYALRASRVPRYAPLQEAFARGIIHSRRFL